MNFTESNFKSQRRSLFDIFAGYIAMTGLLKIRRKKGE